jgi:hypothetical protein
MQFLGRRTSQHAHIRIFQGLSAILRLPVVDTISVSVPELIQTLTLPAILRSALRVSRFRAMSLKWFPSSLRS